MYDTLIAMMGGWAAPRRDIGGSEAPFARKPAPEAPKSRKIGRSVPMPSAQIALIANLSAAR